MKTRQKKQLVLVLTSFPQLSETFIVNKYLGLLARGWDVHILCSHFDQDAWEKFPALQNNGEAKRRVHRRWPTQPRWLVPLLFLSGLFYCLFTGPRLAWRYLRLGWARFGWGIFKRFYLDIPLIRLAPDMLHFQFGAIAPGKTYLKDLLACKLSVSFRGYDLNFVALDQPNYYTKVWGQIDGCHCLSEHLWRRAQERGCPQEIFYRIIPPAIDIDSLPEPKKDRDGVVGSEDQPLRVISVGRLEWKKGYEHAFVAVKLLLDDGLNIHYRIIGGGDYKDPLYYARHQMNLVDHVEFLGSLPHEEVLNELMWADVLLHPSLSEGFCNAVLEAQALGIPVVCTDAGGLPENVEDGVTGFVVPRRDPAALAEKLALLASDGDLRRKMGEAGRKRVAAHFRMDQQLDAFEDFYEQL